jgi:hypothetical protein
VVTIDLLANEARWRNIPHLRKMRPRGLKPDLFEVLFSGTEAPLFHVTAGGFVENGIQRSFASLRMTTVIAPILRMGLFCCNHAAGSE